MKGRVAGGGGVEGTEERRALLEKDLTFSVSWLLLAVSHPPVS